jgi:hypothetical protein
MKDASELIARCRAEHVSLCPGPGGVLVVEADVEPPADLLEDLAASKGEVLTLLAGGHLRPGRYCGWVRFRVHGWQHVIAPRPYWWVVEDLADYASTVGAACLESAVLAEGVTPACCLPTQTEFTSGRLRHGNED